MNSPLSFVTRSRALRCAPLAALLLFIAGCGGGDGGGSGTVPSSQIVGPKTMVGAVIVFNYGDGRSYTVTISSSNSNGVTRSDGKVTTNWTSAGLQSPIVTLDLAYGAFTPGNLNNVFDDYGMTFATKTSGTITLRENTTSNTFASTTPIGGTFTITTYPPNG